MLLDQIQDGKFEYRTLDDQGELTDWSDQWDDPSVTPVMVRIADHDASRSARRLSGHGDSADARCRRVARDGPAGIDVEFARHRRPAPASARRRSMSRARRRALRAGAHARHRVRARAVGHRDAGDPARQLRADRAHGESAGASSVRYDAGALRRRSGPQSRDLRIAQAGSGRRWVGDGRAVSLRLRRCRDRSVDHRRLGQDRHQRVGEQSDL